MPEEYISYQLENRFVSYDSSVSKKINLLKEGYAEISKEKRERILKIIMFCYWIICVVFCI